MLTLKVTPSQIYNTTFSTIPLRAHIHRMNNHSLIKFYTFKQLLKNAAQLNHSKVRSFKCQQAIKCVQDYCVQNLMMNSDQISRTLGKLWPEHIDADASIQQISRDIKFLKGLFKLNKNDLSYLIGQCFSETIGKSKQIYKKYIQIINIGYTVFDASKSQICHLNYLKKFFLHSFKDVCYTFLEMGISEDDQNQGSQRVGSQNNQREGRLQGKIITYDIQLSQKLNELYTTVSMKFSYFYTNFPLTQKQLLQLLNYYLNLLKKKCNSHKLQSMIALFTIAFLIQYIQSNQRIIKPSNVFLHSLNWMLEQLMYLIYSDKYMEIIFFMAPILMQNSLLAKNTKGLILAHLIQALDVQYHFQLDVDDPLFKKKDQMVKDIIEKLYDCFKIPIYTQQSQYFKVFSQKINISQRLFSDRSKQTKSSYFKGSNQNISKSWDDTHPKLTPFFRQVNNLKSTLKQLNFHQILGRLVILKRRFEEVQQYPLNKMGTGSKFKQKYLGILLKIMATVSSNQIIKKRFDCKLLTICIQHKVSQILKDFRWEQIKFSQKVHQEYCNKIFSIESQNLRINVLLDYAEDHLIDCQLKTIYQIRNIRQNLNEINFKANKNTNPSVIQTVIMDFLQICLKYQGKQTKLVYFQHIKQFLHINNESIQLMLCLSVVFQCLSKYGSVSELMKKMKIILAKLIYIVAVLNQATTTCKDFILHFHSKLRQFQGKNTMNAILSNPTKQAQKMQYGQAPSLRFFNIIRKQMTIKSMLLVAKRYKQLNSLIHAIYIYELIGYHFREQKKEGLPLIAQQKEFNLSEQRENIQKILRRELIQCYSRINQSFDSVKKLIKRQTGVPQIQIKETLLRQQKIDPIKFIKQFWPQTQKQYFQRKTMFLFTAAHKKKQIKRQFCQEMLNHSYPYFAKLLEFTEEVECLQLSINAIIIQLKAQFLKVSICGLFNSGQGILQCTKQQKQQQIISSLQSLAKRVGIFRLIDIYKFLLLVRSRDRQLRLKYMNLLIEVEDYKSFKKEIDARYDNLPYQKYIGQDLQLMVKYLFKQKQYQQCLLICTSTKLKQKNCNFAQISVYQILANLARNHAYEITKACSAFKKCLVIQKPVKQDSRVKKVALIKQKHPKYIEVFQLIFDHFQLQSMRQNMQVKNLISYYIKQFLIFDFQELEELAKEVTFIFLRFIIQKFSKPNQQSGSLQYSKIGQEVIKNFPKIPIYLKFNSEYLIRNISDSRLMCNNIIKDFLHSIAISDTEGSSWWIYSLVNHQFALFEQAKPDKQISEVVKIGQYIRGQLIKNKIYPQESQKWIQYLVNSLNMSSCNTRSQYLKIQKQTICKLGQIKQCLIMPFSCDLKINKVLRIQTIGQGKSTPLAIFIQCSKIQQKTKNQIENQLITGLSKQQLKMELNQKGQQQVKNSIIKKIIMKYYQMPKGKEENYLVESNNANFFKQLNLFDEDITYRIINLGKRVMLIQPIQFQWSLNDLIQKQNKVQFIKLKAQQAKTTKSQKKQKNKEWEIFDSYYPSHNITLHKKFYNQVNSVQQWWLKLNNFAKTAAFWSYIGACVGMGDRHGSNILISRLMKVTHIDFQYSFDEGINLPIPQFVPFRLTKCMMSPLGLLRQMGLFYSYFVQAARTMNYNRKKCINVMAYYFLYLYSFNYFYIDFKRFIIFLQKLTLIKNVRKNTMIIQSHFFHDFFMFFALFILKQLNLYILDLVQCQLKNKKAIKNI